ncbi:CoA ester lyase [Noviherbaspirillum sp. 1P10PC]|uniref:HpcH/HpaI aldolase/citrate lyase family protein n=1 Tax=Noviherbaspirillum sp. 1P10PC TaxID=3132292 RepID=UPI0039A01C20
MHDHLAHAAILMRSKLFVPGSRPELFAKALRSGADAISIDLEDAVLEERKEEARASTATLLDQRAGLVDGIILVVRVNGVSTRHFSADLEAVARPGLAAVNLPKVESPDEIREVGSLLDRFERQRGINRPIGILANIESPRGLRLAAEIAAAHPRIIGLQLGFGDLFEPLGIDRKDAAAVRQVQLAVRLAAGEAGVDAYDGAFASVGDMDGFRAEADHARKLGFKGKSCIHPTQVPVANGTFCPSAEEIAFAKRVVNAWRETESTGRGAIVVDGRMIDRPFVESARGMLLIAQQLEAVG